MSFLSRLREAFSQQPKGRSVVDRLGGYEPPTEARPWTPSERPPELPWERDENGPSTEEAPSAPPFDSPVADHSPSIDEVGPAAAPLKLDEFRGGDSLSDDRVSRRYG